MASIHSTPYLMLILLSIILVSGLLDTVLTLSANVGRSSASADLSDASSDSTDVSTIEVETRGRRLRVCSSGWSNYRACMRRSYQLKVDALGALQEFDVERGLALVRESRAMIADQCERHERTLLACCPAIDVKNAETTAVGEATPAPPQASVERPTGGNPRRRSAQQLCAAARNDLQNMVSQMGRLSAQIDEAVSQVFAQLAELDSEKAETP